MFSIHKSLAPIPNIRGWIHFFSHIITYTCFTYDFGKTAYLNVVRAVRHEYSGLPVVEIAPPAGARLGYGLSAFFTYFYHWRPDWDAIRKGLFGIWIHPSRIGPHRPTLILSIESLLCWTNLRKNVVRGIAGCMPQRDKKTGGQ